MNYRHIYHAGNFADVFKHIILIALIERLKLKEAAFFALDTHAGIGMYDLKSEEAQKTNEADGGISKFYFREVRNPLIKTYIEIIKKYNPDGGLNYYPGSPVLVSNLMRQQDRFIANELHPEDVETLKINNANLYRKFKILNFDAYQTLRSNLPPKEKRGLVLIDPPFEKTDELETLTESLKQALKKWGNGVFMIWFPIKQTLDIDLFYNNIIANNFPKATAIECLLNYRNAPKDLNGCGVVIINTPWQFEQTIKELKSELQEYICPKGAPGISCRVLTS